MAKDVYRITIDFKNKTAYDAFKKELKKAKFTNVMEGTAEAVQATKVHYTVFE